MTAVIMSIGLMIVIAIIYNTPNTYDYHNDLRNIAYQLSRIADALDRKKGEEDD